jgi:S1-C subfamily serine protease
MKPMNPIARSLLVPFAALMLTQSLAADTAAGVGSVLRVKAAPPHAHSGEEDWGSAVAVDLSEFGLKGAYLLSAAHVVHGMARVEAEIGSHWKAATVLYEDEDHDVCVLKVDGELPALPLSRTVPDALTGVGFKFGKAPALVSNGICIDTATNHNKAQWRAALAIGPGCSGGAVLTRDGAVAGIVIAGLSDGLGGMRDDVTVFIPCTILRQWLKERTK